MKPVFTEKDIKKITATLCANWTFEHNKYRIQLEKPNSNGNSVLEIYPDIPIGAENGNIVSVYIGDAHLQLQNCAGYVVSKMLGEVIFVVEAHGKITGLVVAQEAGCSLYANIDKSVLSGDFTKLTPEVTMGAIALSLAEDLIEA
ncbi:hypothetical protein JW960_23250 [candidate division KSB1 bacterium]|nr:hypothetical protein [candidate division KSB1 bacterium]